MFSGAETMYTRMVRRSRSSRILDAHAVLRRVGDGEQHLLLRRVLVFVSPIG